MRSELFRTGQALLLVALSFLLTPAQALAPSAFNPKPLADDLKLPLPGGGELVFRRIFVPGESFWGDPARVIQMGDAEGGIFEGLQRVQVSGSFPDPTAGGWDYYLGKYELSKGQFAAVMGLSRLLEESANPDDKRLPTLTGDALDSALAKPLAFVSFKTMQDFIHRYNEWLFEAAHPERLAEMPRVSDVPGFVRLPTEIEWEYAARGGYETLQDGSFKRRLPFADDQLAKHAWHVGNAKHRVRPIGLRLANSLGLHDMLGNVQEVTSGLFQPEIWQGKPGALTARGGSVSTQPSDIRSSYREEVEIYAWHPDDKRMEVRRSFNTGLRLAIGSNVIVDSATRDALVKDYRKYRQELRATMPVGATLDNPVSQAATQLGDAREQLESLVAENQHLKGRLTEIERSIEKAETKLDQAQRESARSTARDALREATDLGRDVFKLASFRRQLDNAKELAQLSTRYQPHVQTIQDEIGKREEYAQQLLERYTEDVAVLGELGRSYASEAFEALRGRPLTHRSEAALELLRVHVGQYREARRTDAQGWLSEFRQTFENLAD